MAVRLALAVAAVAAAFAAGASATSPPLRSDPAVASSMPDLAPNAVNRYNRLSGDSWRPQDFGGNNPVDDNYRRGLFGARRRRSPYGVAADSGLKSVNPYHQFNNARNLPMDVFRPAGTEDFSDNTLADVAARTRAFSLPYGGVSSFRNHMFRRAAADPLFRLKLHNSVVEDRAREAAGAAAPPRNPMGVTVQHPAAGAVSAPHGPFVDAALPRVPFGFDPYYGHPAAYYAAPAAAGVYSSGVMYTPAGTVVGAPAMAPFAPAQQLEYLRQFGAVPHPYASATFGHFGVAPVVYRHHSAVNWVSFPHPLSGGNPFVPGVDHSYVSDRATNSVSSSSSSTSSSSTPPPPGPATSDGGAPGMPTGDDK